MRSTMHRVLPPSLEHPRAYVHTSSIIDGLVVDNLTRRWNGYGRMESCSRDDTGPRSNGIHSFISDIYIAPLQDFYSEALPTTARTLNRSFTPKRMSNCE